MGMAVYPGQFLTTEGSDRSLSDFAAMIEASRPRIFRFALSALRDRDLAETVTQDCLLKAYRSISQFRGDSSIQTWLMHIALNLVRDIGRNRRFQFWKKARATSVNLDAAGSWMADPAASPEEQAVDRQQVQAIWGVVDQLSERQRTVFLLHFLEGLTANDIEAITGISRAAVKVHLFRAVHTIRQKLGRSK